MSVQSSGSPQASPMAYNRHVQPFRKILVALAGIDTDKQLLDYAAMLAGISAGAELHCVHVTGASSAGSRWIASALESEVRAALEPLPSGQVSCHVLEGERTDALLSFATTAGTDLILLGHRRNRSGRRSLARRLAMEAPCSIWMVPEGSPASLRTILVPIDFSRRAADALSVGTAIAEAAGLDECLALHVYFNKATVTFDEYDEIIAEEKGQAFCLFVAPIDLHGVHAKPLFVEGVNVADTINRVAAEQKADLIIMGTRGRSRSAAVLLGSETEQTIIDTKIPILAVKHFGARRKLVEVLLDKRLRQRGDQRFT